MNTWQVRLRGLRWLTIGAIGAALILFVLFVAWLAGVSIPGLFGSEPKYTYETAPTLAVDLVKDTAHTLTVPEEVRVSLGIHKGGVDAIAEAKVPTGSRPLVLSGSTALDPGRLMRMRIRFAPAEAVEIGKVRDEAASRSGLPNRTGPARQAGPTLKKGEPVLRELRSGNRVQGPHTWSMWGYPVHTKGDLLAVFHSVDVGSKKNDLIDALVQLKLDEEILELAEKSADSVPLVFLLNAHRNVVVDRNAVARAENFLKTWNIPEDDLNAVRDEAVQISKRHGKRDPAKDTQWARVELRAPRDGTIVERNLALNETVVDGTVNLFQIADVDRLMVIANASEDDLPTLVKLFREKGLRWTVRPVASLDSEGISGPIDEIGQLIDVNQHSAVVKGHIDNPQGQLRAGQFVTATIDLPWPDNVVEIPASAIIEDGKQSLVFVQTAEDRFTLRRVQVTHRFDRTVFVRSVLSDSEAKLKPEEAEQGFWQRQPLTTNERVLTSGVLLLKKELELREDAAHK